jgi:hypothetical protein
VRPEPFEKVPLAIHLARVCPDCGALVYNRDDAETAHRDFHADARRAGQRAHLSTEVAD